MLLLKRYGGGGASDEESDEESDDDDDDDDDDDEEDEEDESQGESDASDEESTDNAKAQKDMHQWRRRLVVTRTLRGFVFFSRTVENKWSLTMNPSGTWRWRSGKYHF